MAAHSEINKLMESELPATPGKLSERNTIIKDAKSETLKDTSNIPTFEFDIPECLIRK